VKLQIWKNFRKLLGRINEAARCLNMPFNVAAANSAGYNYASGRLDWQVYFRAIRIIQNFLAERLLTPAFYAWLTDARNIAGAIPATAVGDIPIQWFWPGSEHVDPQKEAAAQKIRLENRTTTLGGEYARIGLDWERQLEQLAREKKKLLELDLKTQAPPPATDSAGDDGDSDEKDEDQDE